MNLSVRVGLLENITNMKREKELISIELDNCRKNITFYKEEIENMEAKISELEKMKQSYDYY